MPMSLRSAVVHRRVDGGVVILVVQGVFNGECDSVRRGGRNPHDDFVATALSKRGGQNRPNIFHLEVRGVLLRASEKISLQCLPSA